MFYIFMALIVYSNAIHATESVRPPQWPAKLTPAHVTETNKKAQFWLREYVAHKKNIVQEALDPILPKPLLNIVHQYRGNYSDKYQTVNVSRLSFETQKSSCQLSTKITFPFDIPLRYNQETTPSTYLHYEDIFIACAQFLNHSPHPKAWTEKIRSRDLKHLFNYFCRHHSPQLADQSPIDIAFPVIDHFPLVIYWQKERSPLMLKNADPIIQTSPTGGYTYSIEEACLIILQEHHKIPKKIRQKDLVIFCTICHGQIKYPWGNCSLLLQKHSYISNDSIFCDGQDPHCRTFRALQVFPKVIIRNFTQQQPMRRSCSQIM